MHQQLNRSVDCPGCHARWPRSAAMEQMLGRRVRCNECGAVALLWRDNPYEDRSRSWIYVKAIEPDPPQDRTFVFTR